MDGRSSASSTWKLCLLNSFRVERDGQVQFFFQNRRQEALLAHLALHGDRAVLRKDLARLMWPDKSASLGANRLTEVLVRLSRLLEEIGMPADSIFSPRRVLQLNPAISSDIAEFSQLCAVAKKGLAEAAERQALRGQIESIYGIGLLPLFTDAWVEPERERLAALQSDALRALTLSSETVRTPALAFSAATGRPAPGFGEAGIEGRPPAGVDQAGPDGPAPAHAPDEDDPTWRRVKGLVALAEEASIHVWGAERERWMNLLDANDAMLLESLNWLIDGEHFEMAARLAGSLWPYWLEQRRIGEGRILLDRVLLAMRPSAAADYTRAVHGSGALALEDADHSVARGRLEQAARLWERIGNREWYARALNSLGIIAFRDRDLEEALGLHSDSLSILRSLDQPEILSIVLKNTALDHKALGHFEEAKTLLVEQLAISRSLDDRAAIASALIDLSTIYQHLGEWDRARDLADESNEICANIHDPQGLAYCLQVRGYLEHQRGNLEAAEGFYLRSQEIFRTLGDLRGVAELLFYHAALSEDRGNPDQARTLLVTSRDLFGALRDRTWQAKVGESLKASERTETDPT